MDKLEDSEEEKKSVNINIRRILFLCLNVFLIILIGVWSQGVINFMHVDDYKIYNTTFRNDSYFNPLLQDKIPIFPKAFTEILTNYSFIISPALVAIHQILLYKLGRTYAFEVYVENHLKYSAISKGKLPTYHDLTKILKDMDINN